MSSASRVPTVGACAFGATRRGETGVGPACVGGTAILGVFGFFERRIGFALRTLREEKRFQVLDVLDFRHCYFISFSVKSQPGGALNAVDFEQNKKNVFGAKRLQDAPALDVRVNRRRLLAPIDDETALF